MKRIDYDAFGDVISDSAPSFSLRVGFAGGLKDPTSGLVQLGLRDYEPASGRWTSRDPILFNGGQTNLYAYVDDDPVNFVDPSGTGLMDWAAEKIGKRISEKWYNRYKRLKDLTDKIDKNARRVVRWRDESAMDQSGAPELDCMLALIGDYKLLNWVFPVDVARKTLQEGVKNVNMDVDRRNRIPITDRQVAEYGARDLRSDDEETNAHGPGGAPVRGGRYRGAPSGHGRGQKRRRRASPGSTSARPSTSEPSASSSRAAARS